MIHQASGRRLKYGALVDKAAALPVPTGVALKDPKNFKVLGNSLARLDVPEKVNGSAVFGIDVKLPGLLTARVVRCPVFGGKVARFNADKAKAVAGVTHVVQISNGVAVVADNYWSASRGAQALEVTWDEGPLAKLTSAEILTRYKALAQKPGKVARNDGNADAAIAGSKSFERAFEAPFLAHATMEPMNCTADYRADGCDVYVPTQGQTPSHQAAVAASGLPADKVKIHVTYMGGGFGRRGEADFVMDAVEDVEGRRQAGEGRVEPRGRYAARLLSSDQLRAHVGRGRRVGQADRLQAAHRAAVADEAHRRTAAQRCRLHLGRWVGEPAVRHPEHPRRVHGKRSRHSVRVLAFGGRILPGLRRRSVHRRDGRRPRARIRSSSVATCSANLRVTRRCSSWRPRRPGWGKPLAAGRARGIAVMDAFGSYLAQVTEVSVDARGAVRVHRIVCTVDTGWVINPDTIKAQMEGGIVYGLTAALKGEITIKNGRVEQRHFGDYQMLRHNEMPEIEVYIVPSTETPGGIGEPSTALAAGSLVNAVAAATGRRIYSLPIKAEQLRGGTA